MEYGSMTAEQRDEEIHRIIQAAVAQAGGNWKRAFSDQVYAIKDVYRQYLIDAPASGDRTVTTNPS